MSAFNLGKKKVSLNSEYHLLISHMPQVGCLMKFHKDAGPNFPSFRNIQSLLGPEQSHFIYLVLFMLLNQPVLLDLEDFSIERFNSVGHYNPLV